MKHLDVTIYGRVQGVSFRYYTKIKAETLGITGWIRNEADGTVRMAAEGPATKLSELTDWLKVGPPHAQVERVDSTEGTIENFTQFTIE